MSVKYLSWAFDKRGLTPTEKVILLALADWANDDGECFPGQLTIAEKCDLSERTVRSVLQRLVFAGIIQSEERRRPDGYRTSNLYRLVTSPAKSAGKTSPAKSRNLTGKSVQPHRQLGAGQEPSVEPPVPEPSVTTTAPGGATEKQIAMIRDLYEASGRWITPEVEAEWETLSIAAADGEIRGLTRERRKHA